MKTKYLSQKEKLIAQRYYYRFQMFNGAGYNFLGDTIVYLLAINFHASNLQLGYISSAALLMGIFLPILPRLLAGKNLLAVQSVSWFLRGLVGIAYGVLFFVSGNTAVWLILLLYTVFCFFRLIGSVVFNPLMKQISSARTRGEIVSQVNISFQSISIAAKLFSTAVTSVRRFSGLLGLIFLEFLGFIFNTLSVMELRKVPCRATIDYTKGRNIFVVLHDAMRTRGERTILILGWLNTSLVILVSLIIPFLRMGMGFENNFVVLYSAIMGGAIVLAGIYSRTFGDRIGSKPFLILGTVMEVLCLVIWMVIPVTLSFPMVLILGFVTNFFLQSNNMFISRLFLHLIPEDEGIVYNSMNSFVIAIFSIVFGFLGGFSVDLVQNGFTILKVTELFNDHYLFFGIAAVLGCLELVLSIRIQEQTGVNGKRAAIMLLSYEGLKAYIDIGRLNRIKNPLKQKTLLFTISDNANEMATVEIRRLLASPLSPNKAPVICSLFDHKRPPLVKQLLQIASDPDSYQQQDAIFALGAYSCDSSRRLLLKLFHTTSDELIRSGAAKSLGRIGCDEIVAEVRSLIKENHPIMIQMNYIMALKNMDPDSLFKEGLFLSVAKGRSTTYRQTIYSLYADIMGYVPSLADIYKERNLHQGTGLQEFLEDARDVMEVYDKFEEIVSWFKNCDWPPLIQWCREVVGGVDKRDPSYAIKFAIIEVDSLIDKLDYDDVIACFYFTYQIIRSE